MTSARAPRRQSSAIAPVLACLLAASLAGCGGAEAPRRYLAITHPAIDRVSFFDLDRREVVGVLPTQKLPHDMLVTADARTLYLVESGAQCISAFALDAPATWRAARAFMASDSLRTPRGRRRWPPRRALPADVERHALTLPDFPERARAVHARTGAASHTSCTDCHDRSVGGKPFSPMFAGGERTIRLVNLAAREVTELDAATLAVRRRVPLALPAGYLPVEAWTRPGTDTAFVTFRDSIGRSLRGLVAIVDLRRGTVVKTLSPGIYPWHLVPTRDGTRLLVDNFQSSSIAVVDVAREEVADSLTAENGPSSMLPMADGRRLLVSCFYTHRVLELDLVTHTVLRRFDVGSNPTTLLPVGGGSRVWVLCGGESELQLLDLRSGKLAERHKLLFGAYAIQRVPPGIDPS